MPKMKPTVAETSTALNMWNFGVAVNGDGPYAPPNGFLPTLLASLTLGA